MTTTPEQPAPDWPTLSADLDQLVHDWQTLTDEERIERGVTLAMAIVRPEEWRGYMFEPRRTWRTRWQHVDLCRATIADALRQVAEPVEPDPAGGGGKEHRRNKKRKTWAAHLFGNIMFDFGGHLPTAKYMADGGVLSELCAIAFAVATGRIGKRDPDALVWPAVLQYIKEVGLRHKGWRRKPRPHKKSRKCPKGPPPSATLLAAIADDPTRQELEERWKRPRPATDDAVN